MSLEPAELMRLKEEPAYAPVAESSPLWVSNTEPDGFCRKATGAFCLLMYGLGGFPIIKSSLQPYIGTHGRGAVVYGPSGGAGGFAA